MLRLCQYKQYTITILTKFFTRKRKHYISRNDWTTGDLSVRAVLLRVYQLQWMSERVLSRFEVSPNYIHNSTRILYMYDICLHLSRNWVWMFHLTEVPWRKKARVPNENDEPRPIRPVLSVTCQTSNREAAVLIYIFAIVSTAWSNVNKLYLF